MSLLSNLTTDASIGGEEKDTLGGRALLESDIYRFKVELAYLQKSKGGALGLTVQLKSEDGKELRQTMYLTNKNGENFYTKDGAKNYLPGFNMGNSLALLTTGHELNKLETETKTINLWNSDAKAEVATKVEMIMDIVGKEIYVGVLKQTEDKTQLVGDKYLPTGDTIERNEIDKFFCALDKFDKLTSAEIRAKASEPGFYNDWLKKWKGQVRNKATGVAAAGVAGSPGKPAAAASAKPSSSLFADE